MLVTLWTAYWTANSSLRWSGSLCSVRNGRHDPERLEAHRPQRGREDDDGKGLAREQEEQRGDPRGEAAREHEPPADPIRDGARGERHDPARERRERRDQPDGGRGEPELDEVQVEVDPPEAQGRAGDEARQQDQPGVPVEVRERPDDAGALASAGGHASGTGAATRNGGRKISGPAAMAWVRAIARSAASARDQDRPSSIAARSEGSSVPRSGVGTPSPLAPRSASRSPVSLMSRSAAPATW